MSMQKPHPNSPKWNSTIKTIVGLTSAGLLAATLIYFRSIIGPLILAFILIYLLHPVAAFLNNHTRLSWRASVNIIYIVLLIILLTSSTLTGLAAIQQIQSLIGIIERFVNDLPKLLDSLSGKVFLIGPYQIDLNQFTDLGKLGTQLINTMQLIIGRAGNLVGTLATATASTVGWGLFILVISYFVLADAGKVPNALHYIDIPGYDYDIQRVGRELGRIWNAFLRGQITIVVLVIIFYTILLSILGVHYAFAIAILAGLARFVPYIGPAITWTVLGLVTFFQGGNYFNIQPIYYALMAIATALILDQTFDNLVAPRIMGRSLGVHPAAVLVVAIIAANLIGLIGLVLAAPVLATGNLIVRYTIRKMFDIDPWTEPEGVLKPMEFPWVGRLARSIRIWWQARKGKNTL